MRQIEVINSQYLTNFIGFTVNDGLRANESMQSIAQELNENEHILVRNNNKTKSNIFDR